MVLTSEAPARTAADIDRPGPPWLAVVAGLLVGVFAFAFRLLTLRGLPNDHYVYLSAAQQILLGEIPGRDFVEPGMLLQFLISAAGQAVAPGPATEGIVTGAMLAVAAAATCVGVSWLTGSVAAGTLAGIFQVLVHPRLYSFPKILVPAVLLVLTLRYARRPATAALVMLAVWIVVAFLLRHDMGAYAALAAAVAIALSHRTFTGAVRACAVLTAAVLLMLVPYFVYLEWSGGIVEHVRGALEYGKQEVQQFDFDWPGFTFGASARSDSAIPWDRDDAAAFLFYAAYALPIISIGLLGRAEYRRDVLIRSAVGSAVVIGILFAAIILRHPLVNRVQDLTAVYAILGGWSAVALVRTNQPARRRPFLSWRLLLHGSLAAVLAVALVSIDVLDQLRSEFREARLLDPPSAMLQHARSVVAKGSEWPSANYWPNGSMPPAIDYLHACTRPDERIWVNWQAPEFYVFARRGFSAGHPSFQSPHSYTTQQDQALIIARLDRDRAPIVLINESARPEFGKAYPRVDEYLRSQYGRPTGEFTIRDGSLISIVIRRGLKATDTYGPERWPCRMVPDASG
jgi:hypothetical protein